MTVFQTSHPAMDKQTGFAARLFRFCAAVLDGLAARWAAHFTVRLDYETQKDIGFRSLRE